MKVNVHNFIDFKRVDTLLEGFNKSTGFLTAILDLEGNVLSKSGWRQICTDFHRIHPETAQKCRTSDTELANKMAEGEKYHFYECLNGLVDVAVPIVIRGEHIANLFTGQFFFEEPNLKFFRKQAERYGFDEEVYMDALEKVPVVSKEKVNAVVDFLLDMTNLISEMTLQKLEQAELVESIRKSESRFKSIFEDSLAVMLLIDPETRRIVDANFAAEKFYGWNRHQLSQMTVDHINTLPPNEIAAEMEIARSRQRIYFKFKHRLANGSVRDVEIYSSKIEIDGKDYLHSIIHDITEQVQTTNELTKNEQILRLFVEHSPASIAMFDNDMRYLVASHRYRTDYGLGDQELVGRSHYEILPEIPDRWKEIHRRCLAGETLSEDEDRFPRADGRIDYVRWEIRPWHETDHQIGGIILFSEVITRQVEIREALKESEKNIRLALDESTAAKEQLSQILDRISDGFASLDRNWNYTFVNEKLAQNVGKKQEELLGHNIWEVFPQAIGTSVHNAYMRAMEEQVPIELEHFYPHFGRWFQHRFYPSPDGLSVFSKDIDDQKRAEEKLKEQSSLVRIAAEKSKLGGWNVILGENRSYWSDGVAAIHEMSPGYSPRVEDGINFYAPEWRDKITQVFTECVTNGTPYDKEMEIITSTGKRLWIRTIGEAVRDGNGKIYKVQGAFQDISEKKLAEEKSREKDLQFRKLSANVPDLIFQFTRKPDGTYCVPIASEGIRNIFGCTPEEVVDDFGPIGRVIHPDDAARVIADIEYSAANLTHFTCEFRVQIPGRPVQWIFSRSSPERLPDGSITWYGFNANITLRKENEEKIKTLNERLHRLVKAVQDLSVSTSMISIMETVRKSARELVNADGSTFILREGDLCHYADEDAVSPLWKGQHFKMTECISGWAMMHRQPVVIEDIFTDDRIPIEAYKKTFVKSLAMAPIRLNDPIGAIGAYWSTRYTPTEMEVQLLNTLADAAAKAVENIQLIEGLESRIDKRTSQLTAANKELEAFSYSVSHDLRAPLRHINGYVDLLNQRYRDELPEKAQHYLDTVSGASRQMGILIDDLLQFSRTGRQEVRKEELDMNLLVKEVMEVLNHDTTDRKITWKLTDLPGVLGDRGMLKQVWANLLDNAIKYTRNQKFAEISIGYQDEAKETVFCIGDNGVGFDMKYAHKLFGVFQRLHSQAEFEGTGIGLANVQRIVIKHGGRAWAEAEPGKGAKFYFSLPKYPEEMG